MSAAAGLPDLHADDLDVHGGRRFPYATVGEWVLLSHVSERAKLVYCLLRMHCNGERQDWRAWPSQKRLADMLGLKKPDGVGVALKELAALGAVRVHVIRHARGRRNVYIVNEACPEDYKGAQSVQQYYAVLEGEGEATHHPSGGSPLTRGYPQNRGDGSPLERGENQLNLNHLNRKSEDSADAAPTRSVGGIPAPNEDPPEDRDYLAGLTQQDAAEQRREDRTSRLLARLEADPQIDWFDGCEETTAKSMFDYGRAYQYVKNKILKDRREAHAW